MPTVKELRSRADQLGLSKNGKKSDLERRIVEAQTRKFVEGFIALAKKNGAPQKLLSDYSYLWYKTPSVRELRDQLSQYGISKTRKKHELLRRMNEVTIPEFINRFKLTYSKPKKWGRGGGRHNA